MSTNATMPAFNERETAAVLAGLRLLQLGVKARGFDGLSVAIDDIYTNGGEIEGLSFEEIDELCERLNFSAPAGAAQPTAGPPGEFNPDGVPVDVKAADAPVTKEK